MFPSILNTFTYPQATDRLNNPSHSSMHSAVASIVGQVQAVIGTNTTSALGTIIGDLRNPLSNGGGHVQTAVKGGTGQTTFTKGDLLVATSASVLTKLAVGVDGQLLSANSSTASGVQWGGAGVNKINLNASVVSVPNAIGDFSILSVNVPGSTLGTNNAVRATMYLSNINFATNGSVLVKATYGGGVIASMILKHSNGGALNQNSVSGTLQYTILGNTATNQQRGILYLTTSPQMQSVTGISSVSGYNLYNMNVTSVESSANQTMGVTINPSSIFQVNVDATIVEKIS